VIRLQWKLYPSYFLLTLLVLGAVGFLVHSNNRASYLSQLETNLEQRARLILQTLPLLWPKDQPFTSIELKKLAQDPRLRLTLVLADGRGWGDTDQPAEAPAKLTEMPEYTAALQQGMGIATRKAPGSSRPMLHLALRGQSSAGQVYVLTAIHPVDPASVQWSSLLAQLLLIPVLAAALAACASWFVARKLARPIEELAGQARRYADGNLEERCHVDTVRELALLNNSLNAMAEVLQQRLNRVIAQKNEHEAVLHSLAEGVLAIDHNHNILSINPSAERMLRLEGQPLGQPLSEWVRQPEIVEALDQARETAAPVAREALIYVPEEKVVRIMAAPLRDNLGRDTGAVCILLDMTGIRKLEQVRTDFVANVSHELKTPVTAIAGFVETLENMDRLDTPQAREFLGVIAKHAERLQQIIENLLFLSRLEHPELDLQAIPLDLMAVARRAMAACEATAAKKGATLVLQGDSSVLVHGNGPLLEQAIVNLVDNAIKYGPGKGGTVQLILTREARMARISVQDQGEGIPHEHLHRVFERFYRVDRARSKATGGTGLGLAIVKHIVQLHSGRIELTSVVGKGSTFQLLLPLHRQP
jgi:two-component system phosphate regulon sensor histidine kinase PhoR